jgi:hypothetical protein
MGIRFFLSATTRREAIRAFHHPFATAAGIHGKHGGLMRLRPGFRALVRRTPRGWALLGASSRVPLALGGATCTS